MEHFVMVAAAIGISLAIQRWVARRRFRSRRRREGG